MSDLSRRAESILSVAVAPGANSDGTVMVLDRTGHLRVMTLDGWSLAGIIQEFGASEVYTVKKWAGMITVEGWSANDRCSISKRCSMPTNSAPAPYNMWPQAMLPSRT